MIYAVNKHTKEHRVVSDREAEYLSEPNWYPDNGVILKEPAQWRIFQADADGWIKWHGVNQPLPDGHPVEIKKRNGLIKLPSQIEYMRADADNLPCLP